jgi:hypothetical protein
VRSARIASSRRRRSRSEANIHTVAGYAPDGRRTIPPAGSRAAHYLPVKKLRKTAGHHIREDYKGSSSQIAYFWWLAPFCPVFPRCGWRFRRRTIPSLTLRACMLVKRASFPVLPRPRRYCDRSKVTVFARPAMTSARSGVVSGDWYLSRRADAGDLVITTTCCPA